MGEVVEDKEITHTEDDSTVVVKSSEDREIDELFGSDDEVDVVATQPVRRAKAKTKKEASPEPELEKETPPKAKAKSNLFDSDDSDEDWTSKRGKPKRKETDDFDSLFD